MFKIKRLLAVWPWDFFLFNKQTFSSQNRNESISQRGQEEFSTHVHNPYLYPGLARLRLHCEASQTWNVDHAEARDRWRRNEANLATDLDLINA